MLDANSIISAVNTCEVKDRFTFYECLLKIESPKTNQMGYCLPVPDFQQLSMNYITQKLSQTDTELNDCCNATEATSNYCFKWLKIDEQKIFNRERHYSCLPARYVTEKRPCLDSYECSNAQSDSICIKPVSDNSTRLVKITHDKGNPVLYVGSIKELIYSSNSFI